MNFLREQRRGRLTRPARKARKGQSAVEFALVGFVVVALVLGIMEVGRLVAISIDVTNAAREGAKYASLRPNRAYSVPADLRAAVLPRVVVANRDDIVIDQPVFPNNNSVCQYCLVAVTVSYQWVPLVPLLPFGTINLSATSTAIIENLDN